MKKSLVAVLLILGMAVAGQPAFAEATTVDFTAFLTLLSNPLLLGPDFSPATLDGDENGMLDSWELALLSDILADASDANHAAVYAAWAADSAAFNAQITPLLTGAGYPPSVAAAATGYLCGMATIGDGNKPLAVAAVLVDLGLPEANAAAFVGALANVPALLGKDGNVDGDDYTNFAEYGVAADAADYVTRALRLDAPPTFTVTIAKNKGGVLPVGSSVTFTATAANGTAATYQWNKDGAPIAGANAATLTLTLTATDGGSYTCEATDGVSPEAVVSNAVTLAVVEGDLPVMGIAGAALLIGLAGALGVRKIRK